MNYMYMHDSQTSFPSQYVHRSVCTAANHRDSFE